MSEQPTSTHTHAAAEHQLFVAMRSTDRRSLISPTTTAPDFFTFDETHPDKNIPVENRASGLMRLREGVLVTNDRPLYVPADERHTSAHGVYLRGVVDFQKASEHGQFGARDVRDMRHDLLHLLDTDDMPEQERRMHRIKAELFQQVINLFEGKSIQAPRRRS